ncbi:TNF receptor-associated factor 6 isoform X1 [Amphiprion ocellaris]|uniref:Ring finger protein 41, like n=1 Tax=Amphiprion ocellaris TaxID=80972 RepID=A0AAQ6A5N3_AMPOC|nr:TNF receptor-associated factor 6 isoform X1 [Amphiprion ocellaris]
MGYDLERFVGYVNEGLLCCVCRDVLERPLQAPCEHAYCSACISSWLLHHHSCPEDRQPLDVGSLKPLYRYMRNDLSRLQIRCVNAGQGCEVICSLESLHTHEDECEFAFISCSNTGCPMQVERRGLEAHLSECNFRSRECPNGCGHTLLSVDQSQHNCVAELRAEVELLRAEMLCKVEEVRREMESRLDSQRRHMVQKESQLKSEVEELKFHVTSSDVTTKRRRPRTSYIEDPCNERGLPPYSSGKPKIISQKVDLGCSWMFQQDNTTKHTAEEGQLSRVMCDMRALLGAERLRRQELAEAELEKRELLELLRNLQPTRSQPPADQASRDQSQVDPQSWELHTEPIRHQQREAGLTLHASSLSLHSASHPSGPPPSPQLGEATRRGGTRSLTLDCIKRKSREVTVI